MTGPGVDQHVSSSNNGCRCIAINQTIHNNNLVRLNNLHSCYLARRSKNVHTGCALVAFQTSETITSLDSVSNAQYC
jgi:hypothetical protein